MHWQYYLLASCIQLLQHPRGVRRQARVGVEAIKSQAQFACSTCYTLARHISHKLASLGFIYEPMILPEICLNGNVTTLASQMKTRDSLPIGKQQKLWLQLWIMANTVAYTSSSGSILYSPLPLPASPTDPLSTSIASARNLASNHSHPLPASRATFAFQFGFSPLYEPSPPLLVPPPPPSGVLLAFDFFGARCCCLW